VVVEDGPTLTHGGMTFGAGIVAARRFGAAEIVDRGRTRRATSARTLAAYPALERLLPAMGYGDAQVAELAAALEATPAEVILAATPIDLTRVLHVSRPIVRVQYELEPTGDSLEEALGPVVHRATEARATEALATTR